MGKKVQWIISAILVITLISGCRSESVEPTIIKKLPLSPKIELKKDETILGKIYMNETSPTRIEGVFRSTLDIYKNKLGNDWHEYIDFLSTQVIYSELEHVDRAFAASGELAIGVLVDYKSRKLVGVDLRLQDYGGLKQSERRYLMITMLRLITPNHPETELNQLFEDAVYRAARSISRDSSICITDGDQEIIYTFELEALNGYTRLTCKAYRASDQAILPRNY